MEDLNIVIAGAAGEGIQTVGAVLSHALLAQGYAVFSWQEYESRVRGGQNSYSIRVGEAPRNAPLMKADILLALNKGAVEKYLPLLKEEGLLLNQDGALERSIVIPFAQIAKEELGGAIYSNTVAVGALAAMLGLDLDAVYRALDESFKKKGSEVVESNRLAAETGYKRAEKDCQGKCPWSLPRRSGRFYLLTGNEAVPLGAAYAGCRFIAAYPMTPSTGVITFLAAAEDRLGIYTEQAEDEISAVNMAIGASYAGTRAMTATSGGGFALMVEAVSLAGMTETPMVIVLGQRPGPATGLPTRTAQGDLLFAVNAGHGEFPKCVMAPSDPKDAFHKMVRAFNLADKYQIPVIVLTDQFLADSRFSIDDFGLTESSPESFLADPSQISGYKRYRLTETGVSPRLYPGQSQHLVGADSDEHDEEGHITEDLTGTAVPMYRKRLAKMEGLRGEIRPPEAQGIGENDVVLVGFGSSRNAVLEGIERLKRDGVGAGMLHFTELWPLSDFRFPEGKRYVSVEMNATHQLARLLHAESGVEFSGHISRMDGLPLTGEFIRSAFHEHIEGLSK